MSKINAVRFVGNAEDTPLIPEDPSLQYASNNSRMSSARGGGEDNSSGSGEGSSRNRRKKSTLIDVGPADPAMFEDTSIQNRARRQTLLSVAQDRDEDLHNQEQQMTWTCRYSHALRISGQVILNGFTSAVIKPLLPQMKKDYFGGDREAARIQSGVDCGFALMMLFTAAVYGRMLDAWGRRPFILLNAALTCVSVVLLLLFDANPWPYMIANGVTNLVQSSCIFSWLADNYSSRNRAVMFSVIGAVVGIGVVPAIFATFLQDATLKAISVVFSGLTLLYCYFFLPESLPADLRQPFTRSSIENPFGAMRHLTKSRVVVACVIVMACFKLAFSGTNEILMFYLNQRVGFTTSDNAIFTVELGLLLPLWMLVFLPLLLRVVSPIMVVFMALIAVVASLISIATVWSKLSVYLLVTPAIATTSWSWPVLIALLANSGTSVDQGRRQSAVQAIGDLASAVGPLMFGQLYAALYGGWVALPFIITGWFMAPATVLALKINPWMRAEQEMRAILLANDSNVNQSDPPTKPDATTPTPPYDPPSGEAIPAFVMKTTNEAENEGRSAESTRGASAHKDALFISDLTSLVR